VTAQLHRIEALPRVGQYAVTVRTPDGHETTVAMTVTDDTVTAPQATLPEGWVIGSAGYDAVAHAVLAVDQARRIAPRGPVAVDVPGGWDVSLGNVVLTPGGGLDCVADGPMETLGDGLLACSACGARAELVDPGV
jgi:hypothetical protein